MQTQTDTLPLTLTLVQAGRLIGVTSRTIDRMIREGRLQAVRLRENTKTRVLTQSVLDAVQPEPLQSK